MGFENLHVPVMLVQLVQAHHFENHQTNMAFRWLSPPEVYRGSTIQELLKGHLSKSEPTKSCSKAPWLEFPSSL